MKKSFQLNLLAVAITSLVLGGCGDAETTIIEKEPIVEAPENPSDGHDDGYTIESMGRLAVLSGESTEAFIFDLDDNDLLDTFGLSYDSNYLAASGDFRYAIITNRSNNHISFIDGGLWREDHVEHLHDYKQAPVMSNYELSGSRPTHVVSHDGQVAVFYDGNSELGENAAVEVFTDNDITNEISELPGIQYDVAMHGVAEPRGEHLLSTIRREDSESTSNAKILPDQVGVYHLHDGEYELEQVLEINCPDLHGAAQNHEFVAYGCTDGVLVAHQHGDTYEAEKIANIAELNGLRVGTVFGHEASESFIGVASAHGGAHSILLSLNPEEKEMEVIDWQPMEGASAKSYSFAFGGEQFLILDNLGYLTVLELHEHDGHMEWEFAGRIDITEEDVASMPEGMSFSMTVAQNGHYAYVADPIAQHVLQVHLEDMEIEGDIELDFVPSKISWLGIAEESEHDHVH